jgi:hypothetical protein
MNIIAGAVGYEIVNDSLTPPQAEKRNGDERRIVDDLFVDQGRLRIILTQRPRRIRNLSLEDSLLALLSDRSA